jgi:hypothetical protein
MLMSSIVKPPYQSGYLISGSELFSYNPGQKTNLRNQRYTCTTGDETTQLYYSVKPRLFIIYNNYVITVLSWSFCRWKPEYPERTHIFQKKSCPRRYPPIFLRVPFAPSKLWIQFAPSLVILPKKNYASYSKIFCQHPYITYTNIQIM